MAGPTRPAPPPAHPSDDRSPARRRPTTFAESGRRDDERTTCSFQPTQPPNDDGRAARALHQPSRLQGA